MRSKKISTVKDYVVKSRVTQKQYNFIVACSDALNCSTSEFIRMLIDKNLSAMEGVCVYENEKTYFND